MKKIIGLFTVIFALSLTSCSVNEDIDIPQESLLKKVEIKRDASGAYYADYEVADKTNAEVHKNINSLTNEVLLSKANHETKKQYSNSFPLEKDKLSVNFIDAETGKQTNFTIEDDNIKLAKGKSTEYLKEYGVTTNDDGTVQLDFEVNDNVVTDFQYNDKKEAYEVHLSKGKADQSKFSRTMQAPDKGVMRIIFVNHKLLGKGLSSETLSEKPVIVIDDRTHTTE